MTEPTLRDWHHTFSKQSYVDEANERSTVPKGDYTLQAKKVTPRVAEFRYPGREVFNVQFQVSNGDGKAIGTVFSEMDPSDEQAQSYRTPAGDLDQPARLWGNVCKALNVNPSEKSAAAIGELLLMYPVRGHIKETFETDELRSDGRPLYRTPQTEEERFEFKRKGFKARNEVTSIKAAG